MPDISVAERIYIYIHIKCFFIRSFALTMSICAKVYFGISPSAHQSSVWGQGVQARSPCLVSRADVDASRVAVDWEASFVGFLEPATHLGPFC